MEEKESLVSIVIPIYNVAEYLSRCLDSVCRQTYQNIEVILINDGSTDCSEEIAKTYCAQDKRFKLITQENGGLSSARNAGLNYANGKYITFIDSDDYISDDYIAYLYSLITKTDSDIAVCDAVRFYTDKRPCPVECNPRPEIYTSVQALELLLYRKKIGNSAWGKLYRSELFQEIRYPIGLYYEDMATIYKILAKSSKIVLGAKQNYYYFQRSDGIMLSNFNEKKLDAILITKEIVKYIEENFPELLPAAKSRQFISCMQTLRNIPLRKQYANNRQEIIKLIQDNRKTILFDRKNKLSTRILSAISFIIPGTVISLMGKLYDWIIFATKYQKKY